MARIRRMYVTIAGIGAAVVALAAFFLRPSTVDVEVGNVREGAMEVLVNADGQTRVRTRYVVAAPVSGRLARITVEEGALVRAGDVVARIGPMPLDRTAAEQARAALDAALASERDAATRVGAVSQAAANATRDAERARRLMDAGGASPRDLEAAELALRVSLSDENAARERALAAAAAVRQARASLLALQSSGHGEVVLRAPATGRILLIHGRSERVVSAGTPLMEVGDPSSLEVVVDVLSTDAQAIRVGDRVRFGATQDVAAEDGASVPEGIVRLVEPSGFTKVSALGVDEQRVNVIVDLPDVPPNLGDGYRVDAHIVTWSAPRVVVAPVSALVRDGPSGGWRAFVVSGGRVQTRSVRVGHLNGTVGEVVSGLAPGDRVVLFPSERVVEGARVRVR